MIEAATEPQKMVSSPGQEEAAAAETEPDVEMQPITIEDDAEKEVEAKPSSESMDVEITGVTTVPKDETPEFVTLDDDASEKEEKKPESEDTGEHS